jgi:DNA-binding XRE family transcriptional regulator
MQARNNDKRKEFNTALGRVVAKLRTELNLSARNVSYSVDISKTTLLLLEKGQLDPQLTTFCKIAEAYNLKPSQLLDMVEKELPKNWSFCDE